ncbi:MAG: hypothetical protein WCW03_01235 [Candidatus Paceibacterota bacterium]|jgi:hypothetical protein
MNENNNITNEHEKIKNLESKIWFRLLKVIFIFVYLAIFLFLLVFAYSSKPYAIIDEYNSVIVCDNGTRYKAGDNGINAEEAWAEQLGATRVDLNGLTPTKIQATHLCLGYSEGKIGFIPDIPPYKVEIVRKTVGDWSSFIGYTALVLFVTIIVFELVKRSFFYIVLGKRFF